uniref:Uncharacterized protein n=1 Tax=Oryza punctata TaxID=4537 RepID=A0A0E0K192_ORYPU
MASAETLNARIHPSEPAHCRADLLHDSGDTGVHSRPGAVQGTVRRRRLPASRSRDQHARRASGARTINARLDARDGEDDKPKKPVVFITGCAKGGISYDVTCDESVEGALEHRLHRVRFSSQHKRKEIDYRNKTAINLLGTECGPSTNLEAEQNT